MALTQKEKMTEKKIHEVTMDNVVIMISISLQTYFETSSHLKNDSKLQIALHRLIAIRYIQN